MCMKPCFVIESLNLNNVNDGVSIVQLVDANSQGINPTKVHV